MNAPTPINPLERFDLGNGQTRVTMTLPVAKLDKLHAWMAGDQWEKAQAIRDADLALSGDSAIALLELANRCPDTSGGRAAAALLAALWCSYDYAFDPSDLRVLDALHLEHALRVLRCYAELRMNPGELIVEGDAHIATMVERVGLRTRREG